MPPVSGSLDEVLEGNWRGRGWVICAGPLRHRAGGAGVPFPSVSSPLCPRPQKSEEPQTWGVGGVS